MIFITSYNRPEMLLSLLKELEGERITVIDDGSDYLPYPHIEYCEYLRTNHKGKVGFWSQWDFMFRIAKETDDNEFIFLQDDLENVRLDELRRDYKGGCLNVLNVGPDRGWSKKGYVDCQFMCDRSVLEALKWEMHEIDIRRFLFRHISSGVGQQLTNRLAELDIPMHTDKNYANHGDHHSEMHPLERKLNPLVC